MSVLSDWLLRAVCVSIVIVLVAGVFNVPWLLKPFMVAITGFWLHRTVEAWR